MFLHALGIAQHHCEVLRRALSIALVYAGCDGHALTCRQVGIEVRRLLCDRTSGKAARRNRVRKAWEPMCAHALGVVELLVKLRRSECRTWFSTSRLAPNPRGNGSRRRGRREAKARDTSI
jgi:hypothetical protein